MKDVCILNMLHKEKVVASLVNMAKFCFGKNNQFLIFRNFARFFKFLL